MPVGSPVPRKDALEKVRGTARYVDDFTPEGCWHGATVRASLPHARITDIRFPEHINWDGLVVVTHKDIPGPNIVALIEEDQPILVEQEVRHVGEPILLIAGPDKADVLRAARAVEVDYTSLPAITDFAQAIDEGSAGGCITSKRLHLHRGDMETAFDDADLVVEGEYWVGHQEQLYIEPNGMISWWEPDGSLVVKGSLQCPYYVHKALTSTFALPDDKVRVITTVTGGGFGGKEDFPSVIGSHAGLLALKAGHPVKLIYDRSEDFQVTTKRHPARMFYRTGVKRNGKFTGCYAEMYLDCGAYVTLSPVVLSRGVIHTAGPYYWPAVDIHGIPLATHTAPNGAYRGFGAPQAYFGLERHVDRVASALGIDPVALRHMNILHPGGITATGQLLKGGVSAAAVLDGAVTRSNYALRRDRAEESDGRLGVGVSLFMHGTGFTGSGESKMKSHVGMVLHLDGRIEVLTSSTDMGQGTATVFSQIVAKTTGFDYDRIYLAPADTALVPDSGPTVASRTTAIVGRVVANLSETLLERLLTYAARTFGGVKEDYSVDGDHLLHTRDSQVISSLDNLAERITADQGPICLEQGYTLNPDLHWDEERYEGDAYPGYSWGCIITEVEVDPDTYQVRIKHLTAIHDIGTVIHPLLAAGQVEGGVAQGIGYALMEQVLWKDGAMLNPNLTNYIIPTALDLPELEVDFIENPFPDGPFGAKGVGEIPMNGPAPALANAVSHALGVDINELPVSPERILKAVERASTGGAA